mgnify:CR=1 FL=1
MSLIIIMSSNENISEYLSDVYGELKYICENINTTMELDKMEQVYSAQLDDKLNQLHSLRHDMKNHLIVIDGYASQHNDKKKMKKDRATTLNLTTSILTKHQ